MRKIFWAILIGLFAPLLASAASIRIPPQALGPSLQELAKQSGIQIMFAPKLVEGHDAPALNGTFTPEAALAVLLNGTHLTYYAMNDKTMLVAARAVTGAQSPVESSPDAALDEVEINARHEKLSVMRTELNKLEDQFYAEYNKLNADHQYDVVCKMEPRLNSHLLTRVCQPAFVTKATEEEGRAYITGNFVAPAPLVILQKTQDYQKNMVEVVKRNPKLFKLIKDRNALAQRYDVVRKEKFKGKIFVWD